MKTVPDSLSLSIIKIFAIAGGTIPIFIMVIGYIEVYIGLKKIPLTTIYGFYLWPSRVLLIGQGEDFNLGSLIGLLFSILLNVVLYTILGWMLSSIWKLWRAR